MAAARGLGRLLVLTVMVLAVMVHSVAAKNSPDRADGSETETGKQSESRQVIRNGVTYQSVALRMHSLKAPYLDQDMESRWWDFGGSTVVDAWNYVRLTNDVPHRSGWLFSRLPLTATDFEIVVEFSIHGKGPALAGDGMAMWLTREHGVRGPVFGSKDNFDGLGIFVDTYKNGRHGVGFPYVMAMAGDGNTPYDMEHDGQANELAGCAARGLRNNKFNPKLKLTYFRDTGDLSVSLAYRKENEFADCFTTTNFTMPSVAYLGFSALTGELTDNHDIISVASRNLYQPASDVPTRRRRRVSRDKSRTSWITRFYQIAAVLLLLGAAYVSYSTYRIKSRRARF